MHTKVTTVGAYSPIVSRAIHFRVMILKNSVFSFYITNYKLLITNK